MEIKVKAKHIKISPRKLRIVVNLVRKMSVENALNQLKFLNKRASLTVLKLINSAIATAVNDFELDKNNLFVKEIKVDEGATMKRWKPRARGRATPIRKRTSHINLILGELVDSGVKKAKQKDTEAPIKLSEIGKNKKKEDKKENKTIDKDELKNAKLENKDKKADNSRQGVKEEKGFVNKIFRRKNG